MLIRTTHLFKTNVQNWLPDVTLRLQDPSGATRSADNLSNSFFQIFGHSQHYKQVTDAYWAEHILYTVLNNGYGTKTTSGSGRVAVVESWGYFIGSTFNRAKYTSNFTIANSELNFLEFQKRNDSVPIEGFNGSFSQGWIPWGMLHDLTDTGEPSITLINDQVSGYTLNGIFRGFHSGSDNVTTLKNAILVNNGNSQSTQVNTLVSGYGW